MVRPAAMSRLAALALAGASALGPQAMAAPADCDAICKLQAYLATDHMVVMAPVPPSDATPSRHPRIAARRTPPKPSVVAARRPAAQHPIVVATRHPDPPRPDKARIASGPTLPAAIGAQARPASPVIASQEHALIPGSAPMIATQFVTPAAR